MTPRPDSDRAEDRMADAARVESEQVRRGLADPEPSLGVRLGQIGILGWTVVTPMLLGLFAGRWLDSRLDTGIMLSAALLMLGAAAGFWAAWKWMHRRL